MRRPCMVAKTRYSLARGVSVRTSSVPLVHQHCQRRTVAKEDVLIRQRNRPKVGAPLPVCGNRKPIRATSFHQLNASDAAALGDVQVLVELWTQVSVDGFDPDSTNPRTASFSNGSIACGPERS